MQKIISKKVSVTILELDEVDFKASNIAKDREEYFIMLKG